jgi:hypothetical protein
MKLEVKMVFEISAEKNSDLKRKQRNLFIYGLFNYAVNSSD